MFETFDAMQHNAEHSGQGFLHRTGGHGWKRLC